MEDLLPTCKASAAPLEPFTAAVGGGGGHRVPVAPPLFSAVLPATPAFTWPGRARNGQPFSLRLLAWAHLVRSALAAGFCTLYWCRQAPGAPQAPRATPWTQGPPSDAALLSRRAHTAIGKLWMLGTTSGDSLRWYNVQSGIQSGAGHGDAGPLPEHDRAAEGGNQTRCMLSVIESLQGAARQSRVDGGSTSPAATHGGWRATRKTSRGGRRGAKLGRGDGIEMAQQGYNRGGTGARWKEVGRAVCK